VELRRGPSDGLEALASVLAGDPDLVPETASKLERALAAAVAGPRPRSRSRAVLPAMPEPGPDVAAPAGEEPWAPGPPAAPRAPGPVSESSVIPVPEPPPEPTEAPPAATEAPPEPPVAPRLAVGKSPGVTADDVLAEAGRKVVRFHFARMLAREAGTRSGKEIEELHGMRVATRRMRAAWRVFGDGFRADRTRRLRGRLRVLAGRLGAVRDLDVLIEAAAAHQGSLSAREARSFEPLLAAWREEREVARVVLLRELDSTAYERLVEDYRVFVATEGAAALVPATPVAPHRVRDTAASRIWLAYEQVRAYESVLRWADIETIHQLRIAAKWLRYTLEFFREVLGPDVDVLIPRVVALQDHLGWLHDADVTIALTRQFLVANAGTLSRDETQAIGAYLALEERELARLRRTMGVPWRAVSGAPFRRLLGRAVAAL
jgi:CHAD domain-containing protein